MAGVATPQARPLEDVQSTVIVVDDDEEVRDSLADLLRSMDFNVIAFASALTFLKAGLPKGPACLILDVRLPDRSGLEFQRDLAKGNIHLPIIFITAHGDIPMSVTAMKGGAIEFLTKPFREQDLLDVVQIGLARDRARLEREAADKTVLLNFQRLSPREKEVMVQVLKGSLNKQIAASLGISEVTVKIHRRNMMEKMEASHVTDLVRGADRLKIGRGDVGPTGLDGTT